MVSPKKILKPTAPARAMGRIWSALVCTMTPRSAKSTSDFSSASRLFSSTCSGWVTGGSVLGISTTQVMPPEIAAREPVPKSSLWVKPGSRKCTWASISPGRMCFPLASISRVPSGSESFVPMATNFPSLMATPPSNVFSGVTTVPFLITMSAFMDAPFASDERMPRTRLAACRTGVRATGCC